MVARSNIVLANGETTPVNHTFTPCNVDAQGVSWFEDKSPRVASTSPLGWPRIGLSITRPVQLTAGQNAGRTAQTRVVISVAVPQLETLGTSASGITPPDTIAYVDRFRGEYSLNARDNIAMRKDVFAFAANLAAHATVKSMVVDLESLTG